jgi:hypothetical protein
MGGWTPDDGVFVDAFVAIPCGYYARIVWSWVAGVVATVVVGVGRGPLLGLFVGPLAGVAIALVWHVVRPGRPPFRRPGLLALTTTRFVATSADCHQVVATMPLSACGWHRYQPGVGRWRRARVTVGFTDGTRWQFESGLCVESAEALAAVLGPSTIPAVPQRAPRRVQIALHRNG